MIVSVPTLAFTAKAMATTAVATAGFLFCCMDCNPSLYCYDVWKSWSGTGPLPWGRRRLCLLPDKSTTIWIIGASTGIGRELTLQLAAAEASRVERKRKVNDTAESVPHLILSSRNVDALEGLAAQVESSLSAQCRVTVLPMDVTNRQDMKQAVATLRAQKIVLDAVVLNAGFGHLTPAAETLPETCAEVFRGNALWPMVLMPHLLQSPSMLVAQPQIVVTASVASYLPIPLSSAYCAAKFALLGYFRSLQAEEPHLRIQIVAPGPVATDFHQNHRQGATTAAPSSKAPSRLQMRVARCARLLLRVIQRQQHGEYWIASQPLLTLLYMHHYMCPDLVRWFVQRVVGPQRVQLWREGKDLYDPAAWRRK